MEPVFEAVLAGERESARLLRDDPSVVRTRASTDTLIEAIPHWLYAGDTGLHLAAAALRVEVATALLRAGADPNARNRRGATPLHYACDPRPRTGTWDPAAQAALIRLLVAQGAAIDAGDQGGATPLHRAVRGRSVAAVGQLLELGARCDVVLEKGRTSPLHLAAGPTGAGGTAGALGEQLEIIGLLLRHGADAGARDADGRTAVDRATNERVASALRG
jgi:ankyrin repeat protein